ncbi:MAG: tetratricopeptide repeat protein [Bacteroidales bacterium]|jgi:tetratricopeptide (TPR) repeat protein|nr:tetratricopeptide repeat protein [Bacteroidales bacterium]
MKIKTTFISAKLMIMSLILCFCAVNANSQSAKEWFDRGLTAFENNDYQGLIELYENAAVLTPDLAEAYFFTGIAYEEWKQDYKKAIECYEKAIELKPDFEVVYLFMGFAYSDWNGQYEKAIECFEKAIELNPNYAEAYNEMGFAYGNSGNDKKAIECYKKAAELGDEDAKQWLLDNNIE